MAAGPAWASVVVVAVSLLWWTYRLHRVDRHERAAWVLALLALGLQGLASGDRQLHAWDERFHAVVAKHLAVDPLTPTLYDDPVLPYDSRSWLEGHVWLHKPPLALWLMAASLRAFGNQEFAVRLPSLLLSALGVLLTYRLGTWLLDRRAALLAAYLHAVNGFLLDLVSGRTATDHVDAVFVVLVEVAVTLGVAHARRGRNGVLLSCFGLALGLAILTKWLGALVALAPWAILVRVRTTPARTGIAAAAVLALAAATVAPWQLHIARAFPEESSFEADYAARHLVTAVEKHAAPATYYLAGMPRTFGELVYLPLGWFAWCVLRRRLDVRADALAAWVLVPYLVYSVAATKMPGYVMTAAPALFLIQGAFWWRLHDALPGSRWRPLGRALLALLLLLPLRYGVERLKPQEGFGREPSWAAELRSLPVRLGPERSVVFGTEHPIEALFYTPWPAYSIVPDAELIRGLASRGYRVVVLRAGAAPELHPSEGVQAPHAPEPPGPGEGAKR